MKTRLSTWQTTLRFTDAQLDSAPVRSSAFRQFGRATAFGRLLKSLCSVGDEVTSLNLLHKPPICGENQASSRRLLRFFTLAIFCLAVPAVAAPIQLVTTIDPAVAPPASGGGNSTSPIITPDGRYVLFASTADNLALTGSNTPFLAQGSSKINVFLRDRTAGTTTLVSVNLTGTSGGNGDSLPIELSTNGQYALFESTASDLVPGDTNNASDVFVRDLVNGTNILVSISTNGGCANGVSGESAMTPDGHYVVFASTASNLVPGDTNGIRDIFVRDLVAGVTTLASPGAIANPGTGYPGGSSDSPQLTPDGRYVAFLSTATNLVPGVTTSGEVYVRDLTGAVTYLASGNAHTLITSNAISYNQAISDDGQFVAFESSTNGASGSGFIQRYHLQSGATDLVSSNAAAMQAGYASLRNLDMTPDGQFIVFVAGTNTSQSGIYLWDAQTATTTLVSGDTNNVVPANSVCDWPVVDPSGRFVLFLSTATSLTTNVVAGDFHLYLRDVLAGSTSLLDADTNGFGFPKNFMNPARLTPDGRFLAFDCSDEYPATNIYNQPPAYADRSLVPGDNNGAFDVFVRDLSTNTVELISTRQPALPTQSPGDSSPAMICSVDIAGRYVAYASASTSLVANDTNTYLNVLVHDLVNGTNCLVSVDTNSLANANGLSTDPSISGDGRYVVFTSYASNLVAGYTKPSGSAGSPDVFVRDLQTGINTLVSVSADGTSAGNSNSCSPVISSDGRYVLFHSWANNLSTTGEPYYPRENLSLRDLQAGTTYVLGFGNWYGGNANALGTNISYSMTPDGHFVAFYGCAASSSSTYCLFVWDSQAAALIYTNTATGAITNLSISPDGNRIVFGGPGLYAVDRAANINWQIAASFSGSQAGLQFSGDSRFLVYSTTSAQVALDTNGVADVYLYDFVTQSNFLVSQSNPPGAANGPSDSPTISSDGRFVAYRSAATNILPGATNGLPNIFLYDRQTGATTLLSANASGMAGNNRSFAPQFSGDGQTVVFQSWASDLVAQDFNQVNDLFAVNIATLNPTPPAIVYPPTGQTMFAGGNVTFIVTANGTPPLSYQWNYNGTSIAGATNISLTLTNVQLTQAGNYAVLVANAFGSIISSNAMLTVLAVPPSIITQPAYQTVQSGSTASLSVIAGGSLPLYYQWAFNGTNIVGATNPVLTLTNVQLTQAGNYAVLVTNAYGSVLSSNAFLAIGGIPPGISTQPTNWTTFVGGIASFSVTATGSLPLNYQWNFNGANISGATNPTLTLTNVQPAQAGNYAVLVTNAFGSIFSSNAKLTVLALAPSINIQPTNQMVFVAGSVTFSVTAGGIPPLNYQWNLNGTNLAGATNSTLTLTNVQWNQAGNYAVLVTNIFGSILSSNATLWVQYAYVYATNNGTITITGYTGSGGSVTIPATINGLPVTSIGNMAFLSCASLTHVTIPNSVTSIGDHAFFWCTGLTNVTIPDSVTSIGDNAFDSCISLSSVTIGNSVTNIGVSAFSDCFSLASVTIGNSVTSLGDWVFYDCFSLSSLYFKGNAPGIGSDVFHGDNNAIVYYLPGTTGWEDFAQLTGLPIVLWNPQAQTSDGSFGVRSNGFGFNITGTSGLVVVVEGCSLVNPDWVPLQTNTIIGGSCYFSDPDWTNYPVRCYRLRSP
jgi:Tol biopolymer transport system component